MAGQLWLWGGNSYGALGDNTTIPKSSPVQVIGDGTNWISVSAGYGNVGHKAGIKTDGTLWVWGFNGNGQLGDNTIAHKSSPIQTVGFATNWSQVSCGYRRTSAVKTDGTLWSWGNNPNGELGDNTVTSRSSPVQTVAFGNNWSSVSCGQRHTAGIKTDGSLWIWGINSNGQLGDNTVTSKSSPVQTIALGNDWASVACGYNNTIGIKKNGTLWAWGANNYGQLGDNTTIRKSSPVQTVAFGTNWIKASCQGYSVAIALKQDGTLWSWGYNGVGELGINATTARSSPIQVVGASTLWTDVSTNNETTLATKKDGSLWAWGYNAAGAIGDNTTVDKSSPVQTVMFGTRWATVAAGVNGGMAIYENVASRLSITTQPANAYNAQKILNQPVVAVVDSSGAIVTTSQAVITAAVASGTPSLTGTTNILVSGGVAQFTDLTLSGIGSGSLIFTASGLTSAISNYVAVEQSSIAIVPKRSETSGRIPDATQLRNGELAVNLADKKGYVKNSSGNIVNVFTGLGADVITSGMIGENAINMRDIAPGAVGPSELASGVIGGTNTQILFNQSGAITGTAALTLSTSSGVVTIAPQNAGYNALTLRSFTSQTADLLKVQNSAGSDIARVTSSGEWVGPLGSGVVLSGSIASGQIGANHIASGVLGASSAAGVSGMLQYNFGNAFGPTSGLTYSVTSGTPLVQATSQTAFNANFAVKASSGQVSNLTEWKNTSGNNLAYMDVSGNFFAISKSFLIDHPTIRGKKLRHVSLEGPAADVFFRGSSVEKFISIPKYWINLVDFNSISVTLTARNKQQNLFVEKVEGDRIYIGGDENPDYYYVVYGERMDIPKVVVEE